MTVNKDSIVYGFDSPPLVAARALPRDAWRIHEATYNSAASAELDARLTDPNVGGVFDYYKLPKNN